VAVYTMGNHITLFDYLIQNPVQMPFQAPSFGLVKFTAEKQSYNLVCGQFSTKGEAEEQEDEIDIRLQFGDKMEEFQHKNGTIAQEFASYIALFDGHSGVRCTEFLVDNLHRNLSKNSSYPEEVDKALKGSFIQTDKEFLQLAQQYRYNDGSAAYVVHIWKNTLHIACAGDSRGYIVYSDGVVEMNDDKKKRALGHLPFKETDEESNEKLSAIPFVNQFQINQKALYFVIGTWTFWAALPIESVQSYIVGVLEKKAPQNGDQEESLVVTPPQQQQQQPQATALETLVANLARDLVFNALRVNPEPNISCVVGVFDHKGESNAIVDI